MDRGHQGPWLLPQVQARLAQGPWLLPQVQARLAQGPGCCLRCRPGLARGAPKHLACTSGCGDASQCVTEWAYASVCGSTMSLTTST